MGTSYDGALYEKYKNDCTLFIETGTYMGDGVQGALNVGFENVVSIELAKCQYDECVARFAGNTGVKLYLGDSRLILSDVLDENLKNHINIFFWIDAHCSGGNTAGQGIDETVLVELKIIAKYIMKYNITAVLAMDDLNQDLIDKVQSFFATYPTKYLGKELCINPYNNTICDGNSIIILHLNKK